MKVSGRVVAVIPAENLVAAFQQQPLQVLVYADSYQNGRVLLEALETGVDGVVLRTADVKEVCTTALLLHKYNYRGSCWGNKYNCRRSCRG